MAHSSIEAQQIYDSLWTEASRVLEYGQPDLDPFLSDRKNDLRRCVTLALRPCATVRTRVGAFLKEADQAAPGQHIYASDELHVTVLSIIPCSVTWQDHLHELPAMRAVLSEVLRDKPAFSIAFRGVTASRNAVMVQGFPVNDSLAQLRDDLRTALKRNNLGKNLDRRYRINAAHITAMRFSTPGADWRRLLALLNAHRTTDFGETRVQTLELLEGDWYASADVARTLERFQLTSCS